jgi:hypothetical protein
MNDKLPAVTIDVSNFSLVNAIDTCSIWNLLSSPLFVRAARSKRCQFVLAGFVRYEAIDRPRTRPNAHETEMQLELRQLIARNAEFAVVPLSINDLAAVSSLEDVKRLGRGEIAAMALALKIRCALLTDDQPARKHAPRMGVQVVQTTPHLLGWLHFVGAISDGDIAIVISEHESRIRRERGPLSPYFAAVWHESCRIKLMS